MHIQTHSPKSTPHQSLRHTNPLSNPQPLALHHLIPRQPQQFLYTQTFAAGNCPAAVSPLNLNLTTALTTVQNLLTDSVSPKLPVDKPKDPQQDNKNQERER